MSDRKPAEWMCTLDERILERLNQDSWDTPRNLSRRLRFNASRNRVAERLRMLQYAGLAAPIFEGSKMYEITREGQLYLAGDLDAKHQPCPHPRAV